MIASHQLIDLATIFTSIVVALIVATPPFILARKQLHENRQQHGQVATVVSDNVLALLDLQRQLDGIEIALHQHVASERSTLEMIAAAVAPGDT